MAVMRHPASVPVAAEASPSPPVTSRSVEDFLAAGQRHNTRRSYASAVQHFESEWGGLLPAAPDAVARYLAHYAGALSLNTLRQRLAALSRWHADHGFSDPTKAPVVRQVFKGIRTVHPQQERQARPVDLGHLQAVDAWLRQAQADAAVRGDQAAALRHARDRSLVLLGFWRGFRSDELTRLERRFVEIAPGRGMSCFLPHSKTDRLGLGQTYKCPALSALCPVEALSAWLALSVEKTDGPVFPAIDRWGRLGDEPMAPTSLNLILRRVLEAAGVDAAQGFSSHSLRRGFASWARDSGWDIKELMAYIGWRDMKSALRYMDISGQDLQQRFERALAR